MNRKTHKCEVAADLAYVWIDRIVTEEEDGTNLLELHERLTVISSPDQARRRRAYEKVYQALKGIRGSHLEVRTSNGDNVIALRPQEIDALLVNAHNDEPIADEHLPRIGIVGQLNDPEAMTKHLRLLHVTADAMIRRTDADADLINLARTPLDQLWTLANSIQDDQETLQHVSMQGNTLSEAAAERDSTESEIDEVREYQSEATKRNKMFQLGAGAALAAALAIALISNPLFAIPFAIVGLVLGVITAKNIRNDRMDSIADQFGESSFNLALERVDDLFDSHSIGRKQREAQENLNRSMEQWRSLAGAASPDVLIRERPRLEELAGHIRIIENEPAEGAGPADYQILIGFSSLLAELTRRFQVERVPLLIDDLFASVDPTLHGVLRELISRATNRRQVILESGDPEVARWAAVEVVSGDALLFTDQEVELPDAQPQPANVQAAVPTGHAPEPGASV